MVTKLLDIATRPQIYQTWHLNPPKYHSPSFHQNKGKDGKGKGKAKGKNKGKGRGKGKGKGKITSSPISTPVKTSLFEKLSEGSEIWGRDKTSTEALGQEANQRLEGHYVWSDTAPGTPLAAPFFKAIREASQKEPTLFSALRASEEPLLEMKLLATKVKGKIVVGKDKEVVNNLLIAFPAKERLVSHLDSNHDYSVSDGSKNKIGLTEEIVRSHRFNTVSQSVEFWPGSYYPYQKGYPRSSILGKKKEIYAETMNHASHSFKITRIKAGKQTSHGFDPAQYKFTDRFKMGEPGNATEVLLLFIAEFAHYFVPIDQEPFSALCKLEDVVQEPLSQERSDMETLLKSLQELRLLAPTHFHFDIYSLQYEIIRARLAKCTKDFLNVAKTKKRKPREPNPQKGATWPSSSRTPSKAPKNSPSKLAEATKAVTFGLDRPARLRQLQRRQRKRQPRAKLLASPATLFSPAQASAAQSLESQLAQAMLMVQRLQQQQAVASQQQNEAAPPSSASIPSTPDSEQGGAKPVVETEKK